MRAPLFFRLCYTDAMEESDISRSAGQLIKSYGEKAAEVAAGKVVAMQQAGDDDGMADWLNIMLAIKKLQQNPAAPARR
jgi:hypothetical protein